MSVSGRPNRVTLDETAVARNLATLRAMLPAGTRIWQVCKGDGYGLGTLRAAGMGHRAGLRDFCAGTPEEALALRDAFPDAEVLLFPSADPGDLPALAARGVTLTLHSPESLQAILHHVPAARVWLKVDTGLHRYGFDADSWPAVIDALARKALPGVQGVYTHSSQSTDAAGTDAALALFDRRLAEARRAAGRPLPGMAAASPLLTACPGLPYAAVDPGRALYGMLAPYAPVVRRIASRLIDTRQLAPGEALTLGYSAGTATVSRVGTIPLGHFDGLPASGPMGSVLIRGQAAPVLARTLLASLVDLSALPAAATGDEAVLVDETRDLHAYAESLGRSATELHFTLVRHLPKSPPA